VNAGAVAVPADDLARIVDAGCGGAGGQRDVEGSVAVTAVAIGNREKAVLTAGIAVISDDLACIVDACCYGSTDCRS
jgi:hypothetical protein